MIIPLEILKIKDDLRDGYHILCRLHINGKEFRMLVDTGSSMTIFNIKKSKDISLNDVEDNNQKISTVGNKDMKSKYVVIDEMKIGDKIIEKYKTILLDLEHLNQHFRNNGEPMIDGIIGGDILFEYKVVIDYENRLMILN